MKKINMRLFVMFAVFLTASLSFGQTLIDITGSADPAILKTTLGSAGEGDTILLKRGMAYDLTATGLSKSVIIMSAEGAGDPAILEMGSSSLDVTSGSTIALLKFMDVEISGNLAGGYLMNFSTDGSIGDFILDNVYIHHLRGVFRAKNGGVKTIDNFTITNSLVDSIGGYGVMIMDNAEAACANVNLSNSTFKNIDRVLRWRSTVDANAVVISQCTFYSTPMGGDFIRLDNAITNGVEISNSVFGSSNNKLVNGTATVNATDSYKTSDCALTGFAVAPADYAGASTDLFTDPVNGDFSFKDESFEGKYTAGDPKFMSIFVPAILKHSYTFEVADTVIDEVGDVDGSLVGDKITIADGKCIVSGATTPNSGYVEFDGAALALNTYSAVTLEASIQAGDGENGGYTMLSYFGTNTAGNRCFWIQPTRGGGDFTRTEVNNGTATKTAELAGSELDDGLPHHVVATLTADALYYYIDGELVAETATEGDYISTIGTDFACLFKGVWPDANYNAAVYEYNIYDGALTAKEIQEKADAFVSELDASLSSLSSDVGVMAVDFDPGVSTYVISVPEGSDTINLSGETTNAGASVLGLGEVIIAGAIDTAIIQVTSSNGANVKEYTVYFMVEQEGCYSPLYPELENLVADPELTDISLWDGWGDRDIYYGPEAYCGASSALLNSPARNCVAALDIHNVVWQPNTTYRLHVMVKSIDGSIGFLATNTDPNILFPVDTEGEWALVDTTFTTGANAGTGIFTFNTCDAGSNCTAAYVDNFELYKFPPFRVVMVTKSASAHDMAVVDSINKHEDFWATTYFPAGGKGIITAADSAELSEADVVLMGRNIGSSDVGAGKDAWDLITAPVMSTNMWGLRSLANKAYWVNNDGCDNISSSADTVLKAKVIYPGDAVFEGLSASSVDWWNGQFSIFRVDNEGNDAGNGQLMAESTDGRPLFIRWAKNVEFYEGAGHTPLGDRTYIGNGSDDGGVINYFGFSEAGKTVFFNELTRLASGEATVIAVPKKVAYITEDQENDSTAAQVDEDPIIKMLKADRKIDLTVMVVAADSVFDLTGYDVVIGQESFSSSAAIYKPGGSLAMGSIPVPFILNKAYTMKAGRGFAAGTAGSGGENPNVMFLKVAPENQSNDLFKGITFDGDTVKVFRKTANDDGSAGGTKALQFAKDVVISAENTLLANGTLDPAEVTVCINDIPAGDTIGSEVLQARMIAVAMNFGAICKDMGTNFTSEGLTIWRNAVYVLGGLAVPDEMVIAPDVATPDKKKVAYVTEDQENDSTAAQVDEDPIIKMLEADPNIELTVMVVTADSVIDLSGFDAVIGQESFSSSAAIYKPGGSLAMGSIPVPFILNKAYTMKAGRGFAAGTAGSGGENANVMSLMVTPENQSNDLFKGITFDGDTVTVFRETANDDGSAGGTKALQFAKDVVISAENTLLANGTLDPAEVTVCINDIPAGDTIGSEVLQARMIAVAMNFGAICKNAGTNFTSEGLTIWRNAVYVLLGLTVPDEMVMAPSARIVLPGVYYNIVQKNSGNVIGAGTPETQPAVVVLANTEAQAFQFVAVDGKDNTYYIQNKAGLYFNKKGDNNWTTVFSADINGLLSEWILTGEDLSSVALQMNDNLINISAAKSYLATNATTAGENLYCDKPVQEAGSNGEFMLQVATTDVGVREIELASGLTLYPNPARDFATLRIEMKNPALGHLSIYNMVGQMSEVSVSQQLNTGVNEMSVNTQSLKRGMYIFVLKVGGQSYQGKINIVK